MIALLAATMAAGSASPPAARADTETALAAWNRMGRPYRLIILRRTTIELVDGGGVRARLTRPPGALTIGGLADRLRDVPRRRGEDRWIARTAAGTVTLSAALLLGGGTALHVGGSTRRLLLTGGPDRSRAAWIQGGKARITIDGADVRSWDPATRRPVAAGAAGRPYLKVGDGGALTITGSRLGDLGAPGAGWGVTWSKGATGAIRDSSVTANHVGLALAGSERVTIDKVEVTGSARTGVLLRDDTGTRITALTADEGGGDGLHVTGGAGRTVHGVTARRNQGFGVTATGTPRLALTGTRTARNGKGGVLLDDCGGCLLKNPGAADEPVAVHVTGPGSVDVRVLDAHVRGGTTGIRVAPTTRRVSVENAQVDGATTGLALSGAGVGARGGRWRPVKTGALLYGKATGVHLTGVTVQGGATGVRATRTATGARLTDVTVTGVSGPAISSASPGLTVIGGRISGAATGLALRANATLTGTHVAQVARGLRATMRAGVAADRLDVAAADTGVAAAEGARVTLTGSRVRAPVALDGDVELRAGNTIIPTSFPWLGVVAIGVLMSALLLHTVHRVRQGRALPVQAPPHVLNHH